MTCLIIYQSKSGYTKRYMEMLSESVPSQLEALKTIHNPDFSKYDTVVYAAGVYANKISGIHKFYKLLGHHRPEKLAVIAVGAAPSTPGVIEKLVSANLTEQSAANEDKPEFFYLQGGFDPDKLNFALKAMLGMVSKSLSKKQSKNPESLTEEDKGFLEFFQTANDQTSKEQLEPVIVFLKDKAGTKQ